ncbi:MAG: hypothetical protein AAF602_32345, partial [Myxococcota bacterium]
ARKHQWKALAIGLRRNAPHLTMVPYQSLALTALREGALHEALDHAHRALSASSSPRLRGFRSMLLWTLGVIQWRLGLVEAEATADRAVVEARFMGHVYPLLLAHQLRADLARTGGQFELARTHYAACLEVVDGSPRVFGLLGFAQLEDEMGDPHVADLHLEEALATVGDEADPGFHILANLLATQFALRRRQAERARVHLGRLDVLGSKVHEINDRVQVLALRAWEAHLDGRSDDAVQAWADATALAPSADVRLADWMTEVERTLAAPGPGPGSGPTTPVR